jgi:excisionase family DNA binding protein
MPSRGDGEIMNIELLTGKQCAGLLRCSPSHIYDLVRDKRIPYIRIPGCKRLFFDRVTIDEYLKCLETSPVPYVIERVEAITEAVTRRPRVEKAVGNDVRPAWRPVSRTDSKSYLSKTKP